jgi:hypothetical protein
VAAVIGSQEPTHLIAPAPRGFTSFDAEDALQFAADYGLVADPWQELVCEAWLRRKSDRWCSSVWGVTVPRQNGKNGSLEIIELFGTVELGLKFLHTAHEVKTARKAFKRIKYFFGEKANDPTAKFPALNALVKEVRNTNGQEAVELHNGGSIEVGARSKGAGRGFTVDVLVLDEAQDLQDHELEALLPTTSAAPQGDPVTIYMGTPPADLGGVGEPFVRVRNSAVSGANKRAAWVEFSAPGDVDAMTPDELVRFVADRKNWAQANPALGLRINIDTIETEHKQFAARSFARERLNMWPNPLRSDSAIPLSTWNDLAIDEVPEDWPLAAIGLDMNPERTRVSIAVAAFAPEYVHLELAEDSGFSEAGSKVLMDWIVERAGRRIPVVIDAYSPARSLEPELKKRKCLVRVMGAAELSQACGGLYDAVTVDRSVTHFGQARLNQSLAGATKENFGPAGAWKWNRKSFDVDLSPLMAATAAHFGAVKFGRRRRVRDESKKAVIL